MLRAFPGMVLCSPMDAREMALMMKWAINSGRVVGMRYPRDVIPEFPDVEIVEPIELGRGVKLREGTDAAIIAYGNMVRVALDAAKELEAQGISVSVANARFARPVDTALVADSASTGLVFTIEEHAVEGGFGSLVSDALPVGARLVKLGVPDEFIEHGARSVLLRKCGLDAKSVAERIRTELGR
jgi:1-deoxy-D-xylulose-5-phosphate synthase